MGEISSAPVGKEPPRLGDKRPRDKNSFARRKDKSVPQKWDNGTPGQ